MKTEISRNSHDPEKKYSGVYQQQGRMITDADLNELTDIVKHRLDEALRDVVCIVDDDGASRGGTPRHCPLKVTGAGAIQPGRIYIDGVAAEVLGDPDSPIALDAQPDFPLSGGFSPPAAGTSYKLYADVWERVVTSLEDGGLLDSALHGADTCTRTKTMCQVKWCPAAKDPEDKTKNPKKGNAPLTISLK